MGKIRTDEEYEMASTSSTLQHYNTVPQQFPFESTLSEIDKVVIIIFFAYNKHYVKC